MEFPKKIFIKKINIIKKKIIEFPNRFISWIIAFALSFVNSFKMMPKLAKYTYKNWKSKIIDLPKSTVAFGRKIKNMKLMDYKRILYNNAIFIALLALIIYIIIQNNRFFSLRVFTTIINQSGVKLIVALGCGTIIVARGTDLSAGRTVGLTAFVAALSSQNLASAFKPNLAMSNPFVIILMAMGVGAVVGIINGIIVAKFNVTPFIATLGTMLAVYGFNQIMYTNNTGNAPVGDIADRYSFYSSQGLKIGNKGSYISWIAIISIFIAFLMWIIWTKLPWGRKLFAVGGNPQAAAVSGIAVPTVLITTYLIGGMLYGVGGTFEAWRTGSTTPGTGTMYELDAIAAVIVGGLSFDGGRGRISGIVLGVLLFQTITYGFTFIGTNSAITYIIRGSIIVAAVSIDALKVKVRK